MYNGKPLNHFDTSTLVSKCALLSITVCECVCVCVWHTVCTFYLKTVNDLILFTSWRDSSRLGFKILTKFFWRYVNWLIG